MTAAIPAVPGPPVAGTWQIHGFRLNRWFGNASPEDALHAPAQVHGLVADEVLSIPQARSFPLEAFAEAVALPEAPAHGTKPWRQALTDQGGRTSLNASHREVTAHQRERQLSVETTCRRSRRDGDRSHGVPARRQETPGQRRSEAYTALHVTHFGKQVEHRRPHLENPKKAAGQSPFAAGSKIATHST
ncbi:hypothetical protein ACFV2Z_14840 [Streptomyces sp. NPDC059688]|uniref:hypothetical protein n=1 Tax=Streptomyces sp. NPDC059688 TaxID=3346906 RepID=UPI00368B0169